MIRIVVDSSSDYSREDIKEKNLTLVPITVIMDGTACCLPCSAEPVKAPIWRKP